jgi:hypothetical protein
MRFRPNDASTGAPTGGISISMRANFDIKWFQIAAAHHRAAQEARRRAEAAEDGSSEMGLAFDDELQATMVVVAASAFASTRILEVI